MSLCSMLDWNLRKPREEQVVGAPSSEVENQRNSINGSGSPSSSSSHLPTMMRFMTMNPPPPHQPYHILQHPHFSPIMSNNNNQAVAELTWANGNLSVHGHGHGPCTSSKPIWGSSDTLESIVHQATNQKNNNLPSSPPPSDHNNNNNSPSHRHHHHRHLKAFSTGVVMKSEAKIINSDATDDLSPAASKSEWLGLGIAVKKRKRSESEPVHHRHVGIRSKMASLGDNSVNNGGGGGGGVEYSMCGSGKDGQDDTTVMTWASFESPRSLKTDEDSASHDDGSENRDEEQGTKREVRRSHSTTRQSKASASHNLSERRRRDRINQKMKALQRLVPNASKTDKASMLDEVIEYLKQLQAQVQMMSLRSNIPQLIMPNNLGMGMQQQLQMSLLTRTMGTPTIGVGLGMLNVNPIARAAAAAAAATFVPPPYMVPPLMPSHFPTQVNQDVGTTSTSVLPVPDPFCAYLAQNMDIERYNKTMTELHRQKVHQGAQTNRPSRRQGQAPPKGRRNLRK